MWMSVGSCVLAVRQGFPDGESDESPSLAVGYKDEAIGTKRRLFHGRMQLRTGLSPVAVKISSGESAIPRTTPSIAYMPSRNLP